MPKKNERKNAKRGAEDDNPEDYIDPETLAGEKKKLSRQMAKQYNPSAVEKGFVSHYRAFFYMPDRFHISYFLIILFMWSLRWYAWWEKSDFFIADASSTKPPFVIVSVLCVFSHLNDISEREIDWNNLCAVKTFCL